MTKSNSIYKICLIAFAVVINIVGGNIALWLHLPIYLDSMGTILIAILLGPFYGMLPSVLSGFIFGLTTDIYSLLLCSGRNPTFGFTDRYPFKKSKENFVGPSGFKSFMGSVYRYLY